MNSNSSKSHNEKIGTVLYMAPEQIASKSYSRKIDIYATGITLYTMLVGYHPLFIPGPMFSDSSQSLKLKVVEIEPHEWFYPNYISNLAKDLICKLCAIS
jgi:phosphorylase kinase gamma subunit